MSQSKSATVYFDSDLHRPDSRREKATDRSILGVVNPLPEDAEDLRAFQSRSQEPNIDFDKVVRSLRRRGKL